MGRWCPESGRPLGVKVKEVMLGAAQDGTDLDCMVQDKEKLVVFGIR